MSIFFPEDEGREVPNVDNQPILRTEIIAGAGGSGGLYGGGGGGGGCQGTVNAALFSGAGGNGAQGIVIVTTYF
ncbi:MAG: hypothetical protein EBY29_01050 [Planctomycetes bacterium]|nr:hypothetical protein [Planctomycetota bacterium]